MKRRTFLLLSLIFIGSKLLANNKNEKNRFKIIRSVLNHMFPSTSNFKGFESFGGFQFFTFVIKHPSFDKDSLNFLMDGADRFISRYPGFINLSKDKKESVLREFERTRYGQNWLSAVLYYGLEAMLGDPVYGGNKKGLGWKNINHTIPKPTAAEPFGGVS